MVFGDEECQVPVEDRFSFYRFASEDSHKSTSHHAPRSMKCQQKSLEKKPYKIKKGTKWAAKGSPNGHKSSQRLPKGTQGLPKGSPKVPKWAQGGLKRARWESQGLPRGSQGVPKGAPQVPRPLPGELLGRGLGTYFWGSPKRSTKIRQNRFQDLSVKGEK